MPSMSLSDCQPASANSFAMMAICASRPARLASFHSFASASLQGTAEPSASSSPWRQWRTLDKYGAHCSIRVRSQMQHLRPDRVINVPERCVRVDSRQSKVAHEHAQFDGPQRGWVKDSLASLAPLTYLENQRSGARCITSTDRRRERPGHSRQCCFSIMFSIDSGIKARSCHTYRR